MSDSPLELKLSRAEALVLFDWLAELNPEDTSMFQDQAEQTVLWKLEGQLETLLTEPFDPNYSELLEKARREVRGE